MVNELIEINHIRLNLLNSDIGYVSYLNKIYNLKNNINIKSVIGDLIYARKRIKHLEIFLIFILFYWNSRILFQIILLMAADIIQIYIFL